MCRAIGRTIAMCPCIIATLFAQFTIVHYCCLHTIAQFVCVHNRNPCLSCRHHIDPELPHHHTPRPNNATCHVNTLSAKYCLVQNLWRPNITFDKYWLTQTPLKQLQWLMKVFPVGLKLMIRMMKETLEWWQMGKCGAEDDKSLLTAQLAFYYTLPNTKMIHYTERHILY